MAKVKWTDDKVLEVVRQCRIAGAAAAQTKLEELQAAGAKWAVVNEANNKVVGTMLDVCGFANLKISARGKFFQIAKRLSDNHQYRFYCTNAYHGGGTFSVFDATMRQEMSVNEASCKAMALILAEYGIEARVEARID